MWLVAQKLGPDLDPIAVTVARSAEGSINPEYSIRTGVQHAVGEFLQRGLDLGEVRVERHDVGAVAGEAGGDDLAGAPADEDGRRQGVGGCAEGVQAVPVHGGDHRLLAGLAVDAQQPQIVGVLVVAEQRAGAVRQRDQEEAHRVFGAACAVQEPQLP
jgi:hypothetical protein